MTISGVLGFAAIEGPAEFTRMSKVDERRRWTSESNIRTPGLLESSNITSMKPGQVMGCWSGAFKVF